MELRSGKFPRKFSYVHVFLYSFAQITIINHQIRKMIKMFLATKEMTQTAFLKLMGCNSNSYGRFMKLKGGDSGGQNGVYWAAHKFFLNREAEMKRKSTAKTPAQKKRKADESAAAKKGQSEELFAAVERINLDESAPIYDDCDDVRKKSLEFMATHDISTAEFLRRIGNVNSKSWRDFVVMKGERKGASNSSYVKAYHFLEKLRIHKGEEKSAKRMRAEKEKPEGFPLKHDNGMHWVIAGDK